jgi:hypothetical protein
VLTRTITRIRRDGRGLYRNQMMASGTHIYHDADKPLGTFPDGWHDFASGQPLPAHLPAGDDVHCGTGPTCL